MIGRDHDQCGRGAGSERFQDPANLRVALRDLVVIAVSDGPAGAGVPVGCVRLEEVHPEKPPFGGTGTRRSRRAQPGACLVNRVTARPFVLEPAACAARHAIAVRREAAVQAETAVEWECTDERARRETSGREGLGERRDLGVDANAVVPRTVPRRIAAGHQRRVRRQGDRRGREGAIEARATGRQTIDVWCSSPAVTVRAETIGAQRVDRDEDQITRLRAGRWPRRRRRGGTTAGHQQPGDRQTRAQRVAH